MGEPRKTSRVDTGRDAGRGKPDHQPGAVVPVTALSGLRNLRYGVGSPRWRRCCAPQTIASHVVNSSNHSRCTR